MEVSYRLHVVGDEPTRDHVLPDLPGSTSYEPGMIDRFGEQVHSSLPLIAGSGIAGSALGATLLRRGGGGIFKGIVGGIAGALSGVALGGIGLAAVRGIGSHRPPQAVQGAPVADPTVHEAERVKVMTYNLHGGMGGPGAFGSSSQELDRLADVIRREQPDVLLLQESDNFGTRSNYRDTMRELDRRLGSDSAVGATAETTIMGRDQEVAVMTFNGFTVEDARNIVHADPRGGGFPVRFSSWLRDAKTAVGSILGKDWSEGTGYAVRNTIDTMIRTPKGNEVRVLAGHYEWPNAVDHQARQVGSVAGALDAWNGPTIWGADFNVQRSSRWGESEQQIMGRAGLHDAFESVPDDRRLPIPDRVSNPGHVNAAGGGIDRIYASDQARAIDARVVNEAGDASDHLPVVAEFDLVPDSAATAAS